MTELIKKKSGWRKVWEVAQSLGAGAGVIALQQAISSASERAGKAAGKKIEEAMGLDSEEASKTYDDEITFAKVLAKGTLTTEEKKKIKDWLGQLREEKPKLAGEVTRWIHNTLAKLGRQVKVSTGPKENREERTYTDDSEGILVAESLIRDILEATNDEEKLKILKTFDIKVVEKKLSPSAEKVRDFTQKTKGKIVDGEKVNREELKTISASWVEKSKAWRERR